MACALARPRTPSHALGHRKRNIYVTCAALRCCSGLISQTWPCNYLKWSVPGLLYCIIYSHTQSNTPRAPTGFTSIIFSWRTTTGFQLLTLDCNLKECTSSSRRCRSGCSSFSSWSSDRRALPFSDYVLMQVSSEKEKQQKGDRIEVSQVEKW